MSALKVTGTSRGGVHSERIADVLRYMAQLTIEHRERWMTEAANAQTSLDEMSVLMPQYFYHLKNSSAITAFLLLNSFTLQREAEELRESRRELEDHISKLKSRISELEEDGGTAFPAGQQKCAQILSAENARLRLAHAEVISRGFIQSTCFKQYVSWYAALPYQPAMGFGLRGALQSETG